MQQSIPFSEMKLYIHNRKDLYDLLSQTYFLPDYSSKAINKTYLLQILKGDTNIFKIPRTKVHIPSLIRPRKFRAIDLLNKLEAFLNTLNLPRTGLDIKTLPNVLWIYSIFYTLDPQDNNEIFVFKKDDDENELFDVDNK